MAHSPEDISPFLSSWYEFISAGIIITIEVTILRYGFGFMPNLLFNAGVGFGLALMMRHGEASEEEISR
jgi:hypothetical protein